jgi:hypothetical protein
MWIPIRLLISIVIISFIIALAVYGSQLATKNIQENDLQSKLLKISQSIETLYHHGNCRKITEPMNISGSKRVFSLAIPKHIISVCFGKKSFESFDFSNCIRYQKLHTDQMLWIDSEIQLIAGVLLNDSWRPNKENKGLLLNDGKHQFTAELVCNDSSKFILLYQID